MMLFLYNWRCGRLLNNMIGNTLMPSEKPSLSTTNTAIYNYEITDESCVRTLDVFTTITGTNSPFKQNGLNH